MRKTKDTADSDQLRPFKEKIIDTIYLIFGILAIPLAIASVSRATITGWMWLYTYYIIIACIPVIVLFFLHRISYQIKIYIALLILVSNMIFGTISIGIIGHSKIFIILIVVLADLLLGKKQGYFFLFFNTLILVLIMWLYVRQDLQYNFNVEQYVTKLSPWISTILFLVGTSLVLLELFNRLMKAQIASSKKIAESEKRFHTIIQQAADAVYVNDMEGRIVEVNQQACRQTGYTREELLQKTIMELDSSYPELENLKELWHGILPDQSVNIEGKHIRKDGSEFPVEISISNIELENGKHSLGFARDISERKKAEEALRASEEKFRKVVEASPVGIAIFDPGQNVQKFNDRFTRLFGYTIEDLPSVNKWFPLAYPDEKYRAEVRQKWDAEIDEYLQNKIKFEPIEAHVRCKNGTYRDIEFGFEAIGDIYITTFVDLTERKKDEQQLIENEKKLKEQNEEYQAINEELTESYAKITEINLELEAAIEKAEESEERFRKLSNLTFEGILLHKDGICLDFNLSFERIFGYHRDELIGINIIDLLVIPEYQVLLRKHLEEKPTKPYEVTVRQKDGTAFPVEITAQNIVWKGDEITVTAIRDITDRKRAEKALQESEEKYRSLFEKANDAIFLMDGDVFIDCNPETLKIYGCKYNEIVGKTPYDYSPEFQPDGSLSKIRAIDLINASLNGEIKTFEWVHTKKNGEIFDAEVSLNRIVLKNKDYIQAIVRDISERKKAEKALQESEEKYKKLVESFPDFIMLSDLKGNVLYGNENLEKVLGISADDYNNPHRKAHIHPDDFEHVKNALIKLVNGTETRSGLIENRFIDAWGKTHWMSGTMSKIYLGGELTIQTVSRDITERKLAEKALQESNEKYKRLANATFEGIGYTYMGQIIETNSRIIEMYGYSEDEFKNLGLNNLVHPEDLSLVMEHIRKNDETPYEHRAIRKDGSVFYIEARGKVVELDNKKMRLTVLRDITERKNYEISLAASEQKFRNIFNTSSDGIIVTDFEQNILAANQLILDLTGMDEKQILSKKVYEFIVKQYQPIIQKRTQLHRKKKFMPSLEIEINLGDNIILPVEISSKVIDYENQQAILSLIRDISERKQLQHKIIQTIIQTEEKERSHFAKELHDGLGPLLSTMNIYAGILKDTTDKKRIETAIDRIQNSIEEAILSIRQISNSLSPHVLQNFGLPEAIRNFYSKFKDIKNIDFKFKSNLEERLNQNMELTLYRVIAELINNSVKYSGASLINIMIHLEKNILKVDYADNGKGFDIEKTIKNTRSMGLHNIYNRINSLNGKVDITSQEGNGMKASIRFNLR